MVAGISSSRTAQGGTMTVVYIIGPFRASNSWDIEQNVRRAEEVALQIWRLGAAVICPHTNSRFFHGAASDNVWLDGDIEILKRCDAAFTVDGWIDSAGSKAEVHICENYKIPIFNHMIALGNWLRTPQQPRGAGQ
jgi:hypothetical protein